MARSPRLYRNMRQCSFALVLAVVGTALGISGLAVAGSANKKATEAEKAAQNNIPDKAPTEESSDRSNEPTPALAQEEKIVGETEWVNAFAFKNGAITEVGKVFDITTEEVLWTTTITGDIEFVAEFDTTK